jgi:hypothetical protein
MSLRGWPGVRGRRVTLVAPGAADSPYTPDDFHRQLLGILAELSHAAEATIVRPVCDEEHAWNWLTEPL